MVRFAMNLIWIQNLFYITVYSVGCDNNKWQWTVSSTETSYSNYSIRHWVSTVAVWMAKEISGNYWYKQKVEIMSPPYYSQPNFCRVFFCIYATWGLLETSVADLPQMFPITLRLPQMFPIILRLHLYLV